MRHGISSKLCLCFLWVLLSYQIEGQTVRLPSDTVKVFTYKLKGKTSSGVKTDNIKEPFLAISRDLLATYPLGSTIILYDCIWKGSYRVMDIMGKSHKKSVDIFYKGNKKVNSVKCLCTLSYEK